MLACLAGLALAGKVPVAVRAAAIDGMNFVPAVLNVRLGDVVVWTNKDPFPHTVTAEDGAFDSGDIAEGGSWRFTARRAGTYSYICSLHSRMKGTLKVE